MPSAKEIQQWLIEQIANLSQTPVDKVDIKIPFINYGLESIELIGITGDLEAWLHCRLEPSLLYNYPTIEQLADYLEKMSTSQDKVESREEVPLEKTHSTQPFSPLAYRQEWLFLHSHAGLNILFGIHIKESLDIQSIKRAINKIIERHDNLKAGLSLRDQKPVQTIFPFKELEIPLIHLAPQHDKNAFAEVAKIAAKMIQEELDLSAPPLMKVVIIEVNQDEYILLFLFHHLIFDGFSIWVFLHELKILYNSFQHGTPCPLEPLDFQFIDFVTWQRKTLTGETLERHLNYWRKKLLDAPVFFDSQPSTGRWIKYHFPLTDIDEKKLIDFASSNHVTPFLTLLTAFVLLLGHYSKQMEMIVSVVEADRYPPATKKIIGYFANHIFVRAALNNDQSFSELLNQLKNEYLEAYEHHIVPFGKIVDKPMDEALANKHGKVLFNFIKIPDELKHPVTEKSTFLHGRNLPIESWETEHYDPKKSPENFRYIFMRIISENGELFGSFIHLEHLFNKQKAQDFVKQFQQCVNAVIQNPELKIHQLYEMINTSIHK